MTRPWGVIWPWVWQQGFPHDCFSRGLPGLGLSSSPTGDALQNKNLDCSRCGPWVLGEQRGGGSRTRSASSRTSLAPPAEAVSHPHRPAQRAQGAGAPYILGPPLAALAVAKVPALAPAWGRGGWCGPFCFLCPLPAGLPLGPGWKMGSLGELDGGDEGPLPHAPKGQTGRAERDFAQVGALSLARPFTPTLQLLDSGPGTDGLGVM